MVRKGVIALVVLLCAYAAPVRRLTPALSPTPTPTPGPTSLLPLSPSPTLITYVVQPGDTLVGIASLYGTTAEAICALNELEDCELIFPGEELAIPGEGVVSPSPTKVAPSPAVVTPEAPLPTPTPTPKLSRCPEGCTYRPPGCYLKGEIRRAGDEIYYVLLDLTNWSAGEIAERGLGVLDPPNERWFCTEEEAIANGWPRAGLWP